MNILPIYAKLPIVFLTIRGILILTIKAHPKIYLAKKNDRYVVSRNKNSPKPIHAERIQHDDWFQSKVYQR